MASVGSAGADDLPARVDALLADDDALAGWLLAHSPSVRAAGQRVVQARADRDQSRMLQNPALAASYSDVPVGATNPPGLGLRDTAILAVTLSQTVELGKRGPRGAAADLRLSAEGENALASLAAEIGSARAALARVAYLKARQAALEGVLAEARQSLALQRSRLDNGDLSGNDYDRLELDATLEAADVAQNAADVRAALESCAAALGATCEAGVASEALLDSAAPIAADDEPRDDVLRERPDLRALDFARASAGQDARLARRRSIPDPNLSLGYTRDRLTISGDQPRTLTFGVSVALPFFDRGQHDAARAEARALETQATLEAARLRARADAASLAERHRLLAKTLADIEDDALPKSLRVLRSTESAFGQGELSMTDLLLARRTHTDLVLKSMELRFAAFEARNDLRQALGLDAQGLRAKGDLPWRP